MELSDLILTKADLERLPLINQTEGAALLIDKPLEWTSFDVVSKVRRLLSRYHKVKRFKVGHTGTLDPLATGLLILCIGKATKRITEFMDQEKEYTGTITFGASTPSYDRETEVDGNYPTEHLNPTVIEKALEAFRGEILQRPPAFSAKQVNGKRAYESARKGEEVIVPRTLVEVTLFEITEYRLPEVDFKVRCSKGTYIRSLANDLGLAVDSGAHLSALRRTASGTYHVNDALTVEEIQTILPLDEG